MPLAMVDLGLIAFFAISAIIGYFKGFGKLIRSLMNGIIGKAVAVFIAYVLFGVVSNFAFVKNLMSLFVNFLVEKNNKMLDFLLMFRIDVIVLAIVIYLLVRLIEKLFISAIVSVLELDNVLIKIVNKLCGVIVAFALSVALVIILFQIVAFANKGVTNVPEVLKDTKIALELYTHNPFNSLLETLKHSFGEFFK